MLYCLFSLSNPALLRVINCRWSQVFAGLGPDKSFKECVLGRDPVRELRRSEELTSSSVFLSFAPSRIQKWSKDKTPLKISSGHLLFWSKNFVLNLVFRNWHWGNFPNTSLYLLPLRGNIQKFEQKDSELRIRMIETNQLFMQYLFDKQITC